MAEASHAPLVAALRKRKPKSEFVDHIAKNPRETARTLPLICRSIGEFDELVRDLAGNPAAQREVLRVKRQIYGRGSQYA